MPRKNPFKLDVVSVRLVKDAPLLSSHKIESPEDAVDVAGEILLGTAGLFMGMFVGCLALAIAEMLDSIPIFARRVSYRHGLGLAVLAVAIGKLLGSLYYFWQGEIFPG